MHQAEQNNLAIAFAARAVAAAFLAGSCRDWDTSSWDIVVVDSFFS